MFNGLLKKKKKTEPISWSNWSEFGKYNPIEIVYVEELVPISIRYGLIWIETGTFAVNKRVTKVTNIHGEVHYRDDVEICPSRPWVTQERIKRVEASRIT